MKKIVLLVFSIVAINCTAQQKLTYQSYSLGSVGDTSKTIVKRNGNHLSINSVNNLNNPIPGFSESTTFVNYTDSTCYVQISYPDNEKYFTSYPLDNKGIVFENKGPETVNGYKCTKYTTSINSNRIEVWTTKKKGFSATPSTTFGKLNGILVKYCINGNYITELKAIEKLRKSEFFEFPNDFGTKKTYQELDEIQKKKLIIEIPVFDNEQICFTDIEKFEGENLPLDSTLRFSSGTVIAKRINIPKLPSHYQLFAEITQYSNGDAYDRTASVFVIPKTEKNTILAAMRNGISAIPTFTDSKSNEYQGIRLTDDYVPAIEIVRFFTPFGINHFNDKVSIEGLEWEDKAVYKQEITDIKNLLEGEVTIGAFIGNYDRGGHKLSLRLLAYPQDYEWTDDEDRLWSLPLFNTCNVLEMSGQNYGRFFATDSLTVSFEIPDNIENLTLRYITTGHGGWGGGDEFNQRENSILIDGKKCFSTTPWRCDCATYREKNPVSGNFWNGTSSSDYSRSGWCPGTATQPLYFDLSFLEAGKHTITIAIPQGPDEGNSFSHWMVSGILLGELK